MEFKNGVSEHVVGQCTVIIYEEQDEGYHPTYVIINTEKGRYKVSTMVSDALLNEDNCAKIVASDALEVLKI